MDWKLDIGYRMVREEMVFRSGQILPTVMETMDEQGDTGSQERMEIELPDEGVESQEGNQSFHPSDLTFEQVLEEMAEIHEELKAKSVPRVQLRTFGRVIGGARTDKEMPGPRQEHWTRAGG